MTKVRFRTTQRVIALRRGVLARGVVVYRAARPRTKIRAFVRIGQKSDKKGCRVKEIVLQLRSYVIPMFRARNACAIVSCLCAALAAAACGGNKPAVSPRPTGPAQQRSSTETDRQDVSVSIYNDNFGLVHEVREVNLGTGLVSLELRDVSAQIEAQTVHVKGSELNVLEQNYRYDLLGPSKLLEKYVGKKVTLWRWNEKLGKDEPVEAEVLSFNGGGAGVPNGAEQSSGGPVFKIGDQITYGYPGRISFPEVPKNLIAKPTLVWLLESNEARQKIELTYLTRGMGWAADYVVVVDAADTKADITGWVTLQNHTGTTYENARLKLVAGDVQRVRERDSREADDAPSGGASADKRQFQEEGFFEYHLYTLDRPTSLLDNEQKQVTLLEAQGVKLDKRLIFFGAGQYYRGNYGQIVSNQKVGVYLDIENKESNHLGIALPKGVVRVYKADKSGQQQFIGEDRIDHTPRDEKIRIKMGEAFDVVGDRKQMQWKTLGDCASESTWEIALRNHKDKAESVIVYEPIGGDWEILQSSMAYDKKDAHTFTFTPNVPARGETKITYRVRVRWC